MLMRTMDVDRRDDQRRRDLALIHIARKEIFASEHEYRDVMFAVTRVKSAADLDWTGRQRLLEHFRKLGWKPGRAYSERPSRQANYVLFLWHRLGRLGAVTDTPAALRGWLKRTHHRDDVRFLSTLEARAAIDGLKAWVKRVEEGKR